MLRQTTKANSNVFLVHIKLPFLETKVNIEMEKTETLGDLLDTINQKYNISLSKQEYIFREKNDDVKNDELKFEDIIYNQSILDHRLQMRNVPTKNLELVFKVFKDTASRSIEYSEDEKISMSMKITGFGKSADRFTMQPTSEIPLLKHEEPPKVESPSKRVDLMREEKDFQFNDLTAKKLQEFEIVKINHKGKRQKRILGIDGYAIYNDKVPNRVKNNRFKLLKSLFKPSGTKTTSRPLSSIKIFERVNDCNFKVIYMEEKKPKTTIYECSTKDQCSEILAKLEYLLGNSVKSST